MVDEKFIEEEISKKNIKLLYPLLWDHSERKKILAFIDVNYDSNGFRRPSERYLYDLKSEFLNKGVHVEFIAASARSSSLEEEVRFVLINNLGKFVRNSFLSIDKMSANVWIVPKQNLEDTEKNEIKSLVQKILSQKDIKINGFEFSNEANLITKTGCMAIIRNFSPISQERIRIEIERRGFVVPSDNWLARMLDNIRKSNFILRKANGDYVLTLAGLRASGTAKTAQSPDVRRMLELGRRSS